MWKNKGNCSSALSAPALIVFPLCLDVYVSAMRPQFPPNNAVIPVMVSEPTNVAELIETHSSLLDEITYDSHYLWCIRQIDSLERN